MYNGVEVIQMIERTKTRKITIGNITIGGDHTVVIQSMTNTPTKDVEATIQQIHRLSEHGCQIVRVAVLDMEDAEAIGMIKQHIHIPLVADIHFDHQLAIRAIEQGADKIRINPGNIGHTSHIKDVVDKCKAHAIPIRIGINSGSIEKHILEKTIHPTPEAMIQSARYHVRLLEALDFRDIVLSLKSTSLTDTLASNRMAAEIFPYPLHLGITEAGSSFTGTIRSAMGLGILLEAGIGSTIRVSLTADPVEEIRVAKEILANVGLYQKPRLISCPTCGRIQYDMIPIVKEIEAYIENMNIPITIAIMGCVVNGPGEAKEANIALCGGKNEALLYIDGVIVGKYPQNEIVPILKKAIRQYKVKS